MITAELKQLTYDVQELAGMPAGERSGNWDTATARAVIKKFFGLGLTLGGATAAQERPDFQSGEVESH